MAACERDRSKHCARDAKAKRSKLDFDASEDVSRRATKSLKQVEKVRVVEEYARGLALDSMLS